MIMTEGRQDEFSDLLAPQDMTKQKEEATKEVPASMKRRRKRRKKRKTEQSGEESIPPPSVKNGHAGDKPSQDYFPLVARAVGPSWGKFAVEQLGLKAQDLMDIQIQHPSSTEQQALKALELWRERHGRKACRVKLTEALRKGGFQHAADELEESCKVQSTKKPAGTTNDFLQRTDLDARQPSETNKKRKAKNREKEFETTRTGTRSTSQDTKIQMKGNVEGYFDKVVENVSAKWDDLARKLGFTPNEIDVIQALKPDPNRRCREVLIRWINRKAKEATLQVLKQALIDIGETRTADNLEPQRAKRKREHIETSSQHAKKLRTEPDSEDEPLKIENDDVAGASLEAFNTLVHRCEIIFNKEVLSDSEAFKEAEEAFAVHAETLLSDLPKSSSIAKVTIKTKVRQEIARVDKGLFKKSVLTNPKLYKKIAHCFARFRATLKKIADGCVLCYLEFENDSCYDTFLSAYRDGRLSETLTRELITDDMRAEEGEDLYVHVTLLGVGEESQDSSSSDEENLGVNATCKAGIETPEERENDDPVADALTDKEKYRFTLLKMIDNVLEPGNLEDLDRFDKTITVVGDLVDTALGADSDSDSEGPRPTVRVKLQLRSRAHLCVTKVQRAESLFTEGILRDIQKYQRIVSCYKKFSACLKRITRGCLLCYLDFDDMSCYQRFLSAYKDGRLSAALTQELITDDMRAEEEDLYVHVTLLGLGEECQDDSSSDEEESRDPSQVGSASEFPDVSIKQEPLSPVKAEPTQDLPSCSYSTEAECCKTTSNIPALKFQQRLGLKTELIHRPPPLDFQKVRLRLKAEPHFHVKKQGHLALHQRRMTEIKTEVNGQVKEEHHFIRTEPNSRVKEENTHYQMKIEHRRPVESHNSTVTNQHPLTETNTNRVETGADYEAAEPQPPSETPLCHMVTERQMDTEPHPYVGQLSSSEGVQMETETCAGAGVQQEQTELMYQAQQQEEPFCNHCCNQLMLLADRLGLYWTWLALQLGFTSTDVERISSTYHPRYHPHWCLWEWVQRELWGASMDAVLVGLRAAGLHQIADAAETGELFQKDVDDGSWGSEGKGQGDKGDESTSDGDTDDDGDSGDAAHKAPSAPTRTPDDTSVLNRKNPDDESIGSDSEDQSEDMHSSGNQDHVLITSSSMDAKESQAAESISTRICSCCHTTPHPAKAGIMVPQHAELHAQQDTCNQQMQLHSLCELCYSKEGHSQETLLGLQTPPPCDMQQPAERHLQLNSPCHLQAANINEAQISTITSPCPTFTTTLYPTGEDAMAWNDCVQDFFKADEDTARVITQSWPSNLLVKHLIRDRFFHSYLCEYWKQYQTFPDTLAEFVEFVIKVSAKTNSFQNVEECESFYESHYLDLGKSAYENDSNNQQHLVYPGQLEWDDVQLSSFGLLQPTSDAHGCSDSFSFVHDSIRQYFIAKWIVHMVTTESGQQLRDFVKKSAALPLSCYFVAHLLGQSDDHKNHLLHFVNLLIQSDAQVEKFDHILRVVTTTVESKQVDLLTPVVQALFPEKTLDLLSLPEISFHGLNNLTIFMSKTQAIMEIKLPNMMTPKNLLKGYPFSKPGVAKNISHAAQIRCLSYLPLFQTELGYVDNLYFKRTDKALQVDHIQKYLLHCPSLKTLTIQKKETDTTAFSAIAPYVLFSPAQITLAVHGEMSMMSIRCIASCRNLKILKLSHSSLFTLPALQSSEEMQLSHVHIKRLKCTFPDVGLFLLQLSNLEELTLRHNDISDETVPSLAEGLGSFQMLKKVDLSYNKLSDRGDFLPPLPNLTEIDLSHNNLSDEAVPGLATGLGSCRNLRKVDLSYNKLSKRGDFLPPLPNLEEIDLSHNAISDEAVPGLTESLGSCQNLRKVDLSYNKLSERGDFLLPLPCLEELNLSHNAISDNAMSGLAGGLACCQNLKKADLRDNKLSDVEAIIKAFINLPILTHVDVDYNSIGDESLPTIVAWLKVTTTVKRLDLRRNRFSAIGVRDFVRGLRGKAYRNSSNDLLYDGSQANVDDAAEAGGEDVRREKQQWERLMWEKDLIGVKVRQLAVTITHGDPRLHDTRIVSP